MKKRKSSLHPNAADLMTRKDSEKDAERPHYYSQFWLDVAAGRRVIGAPKPGDENELVETEPVEPAPIRRPGRIQEEQVLANADGRTEKVAQSVAEPVIAPDEYIETDAEQKEPFSNNVDELELQNVEEGDIPDMDLGSAGDAEEDEEGEEEETESEEEFYDEEEEEEEEEEEGSPWGSRSRKKPKPTRPIRQPKKPARRDTRRGY